MIRKTGFTLLSALVFGLIGSTLLGYSDAILFFLLLIFIIGFDIILFNVTLASAISEIAVVREVFKSYVRKGQFNDVQIRFTNNSRKSVDFSYFDTLSSVFKTKGDFEGDLHLDPGQTIERKYSISATAIGKYEVGPIIMYADDPLHIALVTYAALSKDEIKVAPSTSDIFSRRSERVSNLLYTRGLHISRKVGQGYNFYGVREYTENDDFRYVAWSRYGLQNGDDLYIKQMEEERQVNVLFVIDYSESVNQGSPEHLLFDSLAAQVIAMSHGMLKNHDSVGYLLTSSEHDIYLKPERGSKAVDKFERAISEIKPGGIFSIEQAFKKIKDRIKKQAIIFMITPFAYPEEFRMNPDPQFQLGKRINLVIVSRAGFIPEGENQVDRRLILDSIDRESRAIKGISRFFNSIGIRSLVVNEKNIVPYIMSEYSYGKVTQ
jgi:uncharacterized protein (DUF58 family)